MKQKPLIHKHHFDGIRESIFSNLERLFQQQQYVRKLPIQGNMYISAEVYDKEPCLADVVLVDGGVLIHTSFPEHPDVYDRIWVLDTYLGRITYIEISNPNLRVNFKFTLSYAEGSALEMHALPEDLDLLNKIVKKLAEDAKNNVLETKKSPSKKLMQNIPT